LRDPLMLASFACAKGQAHAYQARFAGEKAPR
jgi:hypothetical protein